MSEVQQLARFVAGTDYAKLSEGAAEGVQSSGRDFLTALACAYQIYARLSELAPVRAKGFDHTVQGAYAVAAG